MSTDAATSLYAQPTFLEGYGRAIDLGGWMSEYNQSLTPADADLTGSALDWLLVLRDLNAAARLESANNSQPSLEM